MLDPDSDAAQVLAEHTKSLQEKAANAEMRAVLNRAKINRLRVSLELVKANILDHQEQPMPTHLRNAVIREIDAALKESGDENC